MEVGMKSLLFCFILLCGAFCLTAQAPGWQWASQAGGVNDDIGFAVAFDNQGNQYVSGYFAGTASFGPYNLVSSGLDDIFVAKLDSSGSWLWAAQAGGTDLDRGSGIALDGAGNIYLIGEFRGSASFGSLTITSSGNLDTFIAKLDANCNWLWARRAGGASDDLGYRVAVDGLGSTYVTGSFQLSASFGSFTLTAAGNRDIYAAKLDADGNWLWAVRAGGSGYDEGTGICLDSAGSAFITGFCTGSASFGPWIIAASAATDVFAAKLDSGGNWLWVVNVGGPGTNADYCFSIASDGLDNALIAGFFKATAQFGAYSLTSSGNYDIFAAKLNSAGNWLWAAGAGGLDNDRAWGIAADSAGNAYLTGYFSTNADFGPYTLTSGGSIDVFAAKLDSAGNWLWAVGAGSSSSDVGYGIAADGIGNTYLTGEMSGNAVFGPFTLTSAGSWDIFTAKLGYPPKPQEPQNVRITRWGDDIRLQWDPVTQDTGGNPFYPFAYKIYACAYLPDGEFLPLAQVGWVECEYTVFGGALWADRLFFRVTAVGEE